jgi:predicted DNA binding CopG/RHH family protein
MSDKLDKYEQDIENNFLNQKSVKNPQKLEIFIAASNQHLRKKQPITIRVPVHDLEAIKIKASKSGLPYQTYINMLIHKEAIKV